MTVLIVDAPEVLQRALSGAFPADNAATRLVPDRRTDVVTDPAGTPAMGGTHLQPDAIRSAAREADTVVWFVAESPAAESAAADQTYRTNVTAALVEAGVSRIIAVVPLRASRQPADASGLAPLLSRAQQFSRGVATVATAPVYGPGDELVSRLLIMMRSLPVVPLLANGTREYQPLWHEDLAHALVRLSRRDEVAGDAFRVAGPDVVTQRLLYDRIAPLIDRHPPAVPIPELLTRVGLTLIDAASASDTATGEGRWAVDADTALVRDDENDLARLLGRAPTPLAEGLQRLVTGLPEQLPGTGVGTLQVKHFWADLRGADLSPRVLIEMFRERFAEIMPIPVGVEPGAPATRLEVGATVTLHLPGRGHVQVRVEEADDTHVVLSTLRGHPLAGVVRFLAAPSADGMRFEVMTADRAATPLDWVALTIGGARLQDANWRTVVQRVAQMAGAPTDGVKSHVRAASDPEVQHLSTWVRRLVHERQDTAEA